MDLVSAAVLFTSNSSHLLAGSAGGFVFLKDAGTWANIRSFTAPAPFFWDLDISPDQKYVLGGTVKGQIHLWNFETGEEIQQFGYGSASDTWNVVFSPDGQTAFSSLLDAQGDVIEWRIAD